MLTVKIMGEEDLPDTDLRKSYTIFCVDSVKLVREEGKSFLYSTLGNAYNNHEVVGNCYIMENGKTIATYSPNTI